MSRWQPCLIAKNVNERNFLFSKANFSNLAGPGGPGVLVSEVPRRVESLSQVNRVRTGVSAGVSVANCWFDKVFNPIIK